MNQRNQRIRQPDPPTGVRLRVVIAALAGIIAVILGGMLNAKLAPHPNPSEPSPATEATAQEAGSQPTDDAAQPTPFNPAVQRYGARQFSRGPALTDHAAPSNSVNPALRREMARQLSRRPAVAVTTNAPPAPSLEEQYGIQLRGVRMAMGEAFLDLRYKVVDENKASMLAKGTTGAFLVDSASGALLQMPKPPAEGAFPPTGNHLVNGRTYFALVANQGKLVHSGSRLVFHVDGAGPTKVVVR